MSETILPFAAKHPIVIGYTQCYAFECHQLFVLQPQNVLIEYIRRILLIACFITYLICIMLIIVQLLVCHLLSYEFFTIKTLKYLFVYPFYFVVVYFSPRVQSLYSSFHFWS
jgi:hypothetical protein